MSQESVISRSNQRYDEARAQGRTPHERVLWGDPERQYRRFVELIRLAGDIEAPGLDLLDIGCGNGELVNCLNHHGFRGRYRGIDVHAGHIEEARSRFPEADFRVCDILSEEIEAADLVLVSGVFNVDCGQDLRFVEEFIRRCAELARDRVAFNAISTYVSRQDKGMFYLAPEAVIGIAARVSPRFELRHGFLPFNYTLCIHVAEATKPASQPSAA